jgi:hypothetical protein
MSYREPTHAAPGSLRALPAGNGNGGVPDPGKRAQPSVESANAQRLDDRGVAEVRRHLTHALERATLDLILAAHEVNRWDLDARAVTELCERAKDYVYALERTKVGP